MTHIEMVKEIINSFIETECKTNSNTVLKRKWRKTIENVVNKNFSFFTNETVESLIIPTFSLILENGGTIPLWDALDEEKLVCLFYKELLHKLLLKNARLKYEKIKNTRDYFINKADFCEILEEFLLLYDDKMEKMCDFKRDAFFKKKNTGNEIEDFLPIAKETIKELYWTEKLFAEDNNIVEWELFDDFIDTFRRKQKKCTNIIPVFKDCNLFMKNIVDSGTQRISQIYLENNELELNYEISAIYVALKLREMLKSKETQYPFISTKKFLKLVEEL